MPGAKDTVLDYEAVRSYNRNVFLLNHAWAFRAYSTIDENFDRLGRVLSKGRDANGKSHVSLIPFFLLMRRQGMNAFWALCSHQSFEAWVLLRPCLESALIVGKWTDDPAAAHIWERRDKDRESYKKEYTGKRLRSKSLAHSDKLQAVLSRINDDFMHANPDYYRRHIEQKGGRDSTIQLNLHYFDTELDHETHLLAFLNLVMVVQHCLSSLLNALLVDQPDVDVGYATFRDAYRERYKAFLGKHEAQATVLEELGLWPFTEL